jgi:hypothetical protein
MSRWLVITIAAIVIASALTIGLVYMLLKNSERDEKAADDEYLKQKGDLLKIAVDSKMKDDSSVVRVQSGNVLKNVDSTKKVVSKSNSMLATVIAKQKAMIESLKKKYSEEKNKLNSK